MSFDLKEKRLKSVEGLLFLNNQNKKQYADDLLSGENESYKKERQKYVQYLLQKHQKALPTELKKDKLTRTVRRVATLRSKKEEKKEKNKDDKDDDKEDLGVGDESPAMEEEGDFEDEEDMDAGENDRFEDRDDYGGSDGGDGDGGDY